MDVLKSLRSYFLENIKFQKSLKYIINIIAK